jgi:hypothetical protein
MTSLVLGQLEISQKIAMHRLRRPKRTINTEKRTGSYKDVGPYVALRAYIVCQVLFICKSFKTDFKTIKKNLRIQ